MPPVRPLRIRRLLAAVPLTLTLALAGVVAAPVPAALAGGTGACTVKKATNSPTLLYTDVQSAVNGVSQGSTLEVRGICLGPVVIDKNLTLVGKSTSEYPLAGIYGQESVRVLEVDAGATVTVRKLEIGFGLVDGEGEDGKGGGILNKGTLTLTNVTVMENDAQNGGGIANLGALTLDGATKVHHNRASRDGAGIFTEGRLTLRDSAAVYSNTSQDFGGGIAAVGQPANPRSLAMHDESVVRNNSAVDGAGILALGFKVLLDGSASVRGNVATDEGGGFLAGYGRVTLTGSARLRGNTAGRGGGFHSYDASPATLILKGRSMVSGNTATSIVAGILTEGDLTMSGSASVRDHQAAPLAVIAIVGTTEKRPVFTMKDSSRVTANTIAGEDAAAVVRACQLLPTFVGLKPRVKGNTPRNIATTTC